MLTIIKNFLKPPPIERPQARLIENHSINPMNIDKHAAKVIRVIHDHGYKAYLVGGAVRDLLVGITPKDFDIATDAHPEVVKKMFKNSLLIGRRFKLVHVRFGREVIEVATFRGEHKKSAKYDRRSTGKRGMLLRDNVFGTLDTDVWRRDFTMNALYYDYMQNILVDYVGATEDITSRVVRIIGEADARYAEDPVRMLRALRYSAKLGFSLEDETSSSLQQQKHLLEQVSPERILVEVIKTFYGGFASKSYSMLQQYDFFSVLFPRVQRVIMHKEPGYRCAAELVERACYQTDRRYARGDTLSNAYLFVVLLWPLVQSTLYKMPKNQKHYMENVRTAIHEVLNQHECPIAIPRIILELCEQIWLLQFQFTLREAEKIGSIIAHPKFRMAYDFLLLRAQVETGITSLATWWFNYQHADTESREAMVASYTDRVARLRAMRPKSRTKRRPPGNKRSAHK